jgi:antitoxin component YwqK of YwqJK toxin-antitoxin module
MVNSNKYAFVKMLKKRTLYSEIPYVKGKENGIAKWYYPSGKLQSEGPCMNGEEDGIGRMYYESGELKAVYPYKNGVEDGMEKEYYEKETYYKRGNVINIKNYDENGNEIK